MTGLLGRLGRGLRESREPLLVFAVTRGSLFLLAHLSLAVLPLNTDPSVATPTGAPWRGFPENLWLDGWTRWDAGWYRHIATHGYVDQAVGPSGQRNLAFYPLYPLAMRLVSLVGLSPLAAGILVSNLAFLVTLLLLHRMVGTRFGADAAGRCVWLLAVFPFSFYFSAVYSESLFLLLAVASLYLAERGRWAAASLCALLCGATRAPGGALAPALGLLYLERIRFDVRQVRPDVLWLGLSVLGPFLFYGYLAVQFGDPWLAFKATRVPGWWQGGFSLKPIERAVRSMRSLENLRTGQFLVVYNLNLLAAALGLITLVAVFRRQPLAWGVFALLIVAAGVIQPGCWGRYVLPAFPVFLAWAMGLESRWGFTGAVTFSSLLLALLTILYTHWYWVS
jgi:Mannosyltransferase (PIG-V)